MATLNQYRIVYTAKSFPIYSNVVIQSCQARKLNLYIWLERSSALNIFATILSNYGNALRYLTWFLKVMHH